MQPRERAPRAPLRGEAGTAYALDEAIADVLSGPLEHFGTGEWFGMFRVDACAYRNQRVIVVNLYCTVREKRAFGIVIFSPTRGRVHLYAEGEQPISKTRRADWFTFKAESAPPLVDDKLDALTLDYSYAKLRVWDEKRYYRHIPACFGGMEIRNPQLGCLQEKPGQVDAWKQRNMPFLDDPPEDWYRVVKLIRERAPADSQRK